MLLEEGLPESCLRRSRGRVVDAAEQNQKMGGAGRAVERLGFLLPCRMPANARNLKEDAPGVGTASGKPVLSSPLEDLRIEAIS